MNKLLVIVIAGIAGAAVWRRKDVRDGAGKASQAVAGAADSARSRLRPGQDDEDTVEAEGDGGGSQDPDVISIHEAAVDASPTGTVDAGLPEVALDPEVAVESAAADSKS